ncbi:MAG: hypothetical protein ACJ77A_05155 [Actinomycetota bacterium]
MRRIALAAAGALMLSAIGLAGTSGGALAASTTRTQFGAPVKVTPTGGGGYEPGVYTDGFGNIFATAHKENAELLLSPDPNSPTYTRSMSWDWYSADGGKTFHDLPGLSPASLEQHDFGDEGDMSIDDAHHLYFTDTNVGDVTFTRWTVSGLGQYSLDFHRPVAPAGEPVDDRPWVVSHLDGHVFYFGNEGDKVTYTGGQGQPGSGNGPGRYTVYQSYDGGQTFNLTGYTLNDSGWCRPAAESGTSYVYAFCTNDGGSDDFSTPVQANGTLWAYVSSDDGRTFSRYKAGSYKALDTTTSWPSVYVAPDHSIWALYVDATKLDANDDPVGNKLVLFHSTDHGKTWSHQDITPQAGRYHYAWLAVSPSGKRLGIDYYYRPNDSQPWYVYGAIFSPSQKPVPVSLDPQNPVAPADHEPPGDFLECAFNADGTLDAIWTRDVVTTPVATLFRDIYFARSLTG